MTSADISKAQELAAEMWEKINNNTETAY